MSGESAQDAFETLTPAVVENVAYVEFEDGDPRNPQNYPLLKKWAITLVSCCFNGMTAAAASSFSISTPSLVQDLHCTELQAALGLGLYAVGFGVVPLVSSSFSEEVGRKPVYIFSAVMFTLTQVMVALAPNASAMIAGRALEGIFGSIGATLVGGIIADIWKPQERGLPMSLFAFTMMFSLGLGSVIGGVIQSRPSLGWRWVQWIHVMFSCVCIVLVSLTSETRSSIILIQIARNKRKLTGNDIHKAKAEIDKESIWKLVKISCTRPMYFLLTEPIVQSFSIWCGFTWGVVFCLLEAITPIFEQVYGFSVRQAGFVYITSSIGAIIGFIANMYQDKLYMRHYARKKQEARLYVVCVAALCLPIGMIIFAWTASLSIHWIVPIIGLTVFMSGTMIILQVTFLYLADWYAHPASHDNDFTTPPATTPTRPLPKRGKTYVVSAIRGFEHRATFPTGNLMALAFPLLTRAMFARLTYRWALTLFAVVALVMAPTPFVLFVYGSKIRARSIASRRILDADTRPSSDPEPGKV